MCSNSQCQMFGGSCEDLPTGWGILPDGVACTVLRAGQVVDAMFNPLQTLELFYHRAVDFLRVFIQTEIIIWKIAGVIAGIGLLLYIASWIGGLVAFINIFI